MPLSDAVKRSSCGHSLEENSIAVPMDSSTNWSVTSRRYVPQGRSCNWTMSIERCGEGFPVATKREGNRRSRFLRVVCQRPHRPGILQLSDIHRCDDLSRLVRLLATRMATPLKIENVSNDIAVPKTTVDRYVSLLEEVFLIKRIPAWSNSATSRQDAGRTRTGSRELRARRTRSTADVDRGLCNAQPLPQRRRPRSRCRDRASRWKGLGNRS